MEKDCRWLTKIIDINLNDFQNEYEHAYSLFKRDFIDSCPTFYGKKVIPRKNPAFNKKYYSFDHITTKDYNRYDGKNSNTHDDRQPDIRRLERIEWVRELIENPHCIPQRLECSKCRGTFYWYEDYKNTYRVNILIPDEKFTVIFEKKKNSDYYLLVTAYYLYNDLQVQKKINKYNKQKGYIPTKL